MDGIKENGRKNSVEISKTEEKTSDAERKPVFSKSFLNIVLFGSSIGLVVVAILYAFKIKVCFLNNLQPWVNSYITLFCGYIGGAFVYEKFRENKSGGTKYYPTQYGKRKLGKMIEEYNKQYDEETYYKATQFVLDVSSNRNEEYFHMVWLLQINHDFRKVWNDFNYYFGMDVKKREDNLYFQSVKKYVYLQVYNKFGEKENA